VRRRLFNNEQLPIHGSRRAFHHQLIVLIVREGVLMTVAAHLYDTFDR
jgi:hypothetical protein